MSTNMTLIEAKTLTSATPSITFSAIPQTYTDLKILVSARDDRSGQPNTDLSLRVGYNGTINTGSIYSNRQLYGNGSAAGSQSSSTDYAYLGMSNGPTSTANTFGNTEIYIPNYTSANNKSVSTDGVSENNATTAYAVLNANLISTSNPITDIQISAVYGSGNFESGSTFYLYGISNVTSTAKATGGIVSSDETYWYHMFPYSSTFTPTAALTADYLVVAGGGGAVWSGGGAGGLRSTVTATGGGGSLESALSLTASAYTITVGGGGAGASSARGTNGSDSSIAGSGITTVTSTGGGGGASSGSTTDRTGKDGGSGGGGGRNGGSGAGGAGTANQGYAGGNGAEAASYYGSGGGGGASAVGANATGSAGGNGGAGVAVSITGSSITYAGGGGGSVYVGGTAGTGGYGGGGAGAAISGTAGTANTGGGGGGGNNGSGSGSGAAGGSGVVIIRYAK